MTASAMFKFGFTGTTGIDCSDLASSKAMQAAAKESSKASASVWGSRGDGHSLILQTHGLAYAKRLEHNTSLPCRGCMVGMHRHTFAVGIGKPSNQFLGQGMLVYA